MSSVIHDIQDTETLSLRRSSSRFARHSLTISLNTTDATTYSGPAPCGPLPALLFESLGLHSSATPERQYAALFEPSRPVDPCLVREQLAALLLQQQEGKATWLGCESGFYDDGSPPPEFWNTDPLASPSVLRHRPATEKHSPPGPPTPALIEPRTMTGQKRAHNHLRSDNKTDDGHGCRHTIPELEYSEADRSRAKKRRKVQAVRLVE
ncbi:hypothetical protein MY4824_003191 [Beauveria thailandica]